LKEFGQKISDADKKGIQDKIDALRKALAGSDITAIKKGMEELSKASHKLAEVVYKEAAKKQQSQSAKGPVQADPKKADSEKDKEEPKKAKEEDIIEAEYKEEDDKKSK